MPVPIQGEVGLRLKFKLASSINKGSDVMLPVPAESENPTMHEYVVVSAEPIVDAGPLLTKIQFLAVSLWPTYIISLGDSSADEKITIQLFI